MLVLTESDANYTNEVAEYEEKLELVYDDSSYQSTFILYKDIRYLIPTLGGLLSAISLVLIPLKYCLNK